MNRQHASDRQSLEESAEWIEKLRRGDAADQERFARWLLEEQKHVHDFLFMSAIDEELRHFDRERRFTVEGQSRRVEHGRPTARMRTPVLGWVAVTAMAAALAFVLVRPVSIPPPATQPGGWRDYHTGAGEKTVVTLPDGSTVTLNSRSQMSARVSNDAREVKLEGGEAFFNVAKDVSRPFDVNATNVSVAVVGTQFNVNSYDRERAIVAVVDGRVHAKSTSGVEQATLEKGQAATFNSEGKVHVDSDPDVAGKVSWVEGKFNYLDTTFMELASRFNQTNTVKIVVKGPLRGAETHRAVSLDAKNPEAFVREFAKDYGWSVETDDRGNLIVSDPGASGR